MPKRDHNPSPILSVRGLYGRNDRLSPPQGFLSQAKNIVYSPKQQSISDPLQIVEQPVMLRLREGFQANTTLDHNSERFYMYEKTGDTRIIYLRSGTDEIWDDTAGASILTFPSNSDDFHGITINNRFYFTPSDLTTGTAAGFVYVYDPSISATARKIAGVPPTGTFTVAVSATNGTIEPGLHIVAVSYETTTGFRTAPALHQTFTAPSGTRKKLDLTAIPTGPAGTAKRLIWMSQLVREYDSNPAAVELFLIATIADNTTTTGVVDAYDSQLVNSADPYVDALSEVPAGTFLTLLGGKLVVVGNNANPSTIYVSNENEPENFDSIDGLRTIDKGNGAGFKTARELRGNLAVFKSNRTYMLKPNGDVPANWPYDIVDTVLGAEPYSVGEVLNNYNPLLDVLVVANASGLFLFDSNYVNRLKPLSYYVDDLWSTLLKPSILPFLKTLVDPINFRIYVITPVKNLTQAFVWWMFDFRDGLDADGVKAAIWDFYFGGSNNNTLKDGHVFYNTTTAASSIYSTVDGQPLLVRLDTNSQTDIFDQLNTTPKYGEPEYQIGFKFSDEELNIVHVDGFKMYVFGDGDNATAFSIVTNGVTSPITIDLGLLSPQVQEFKLNAVSELIEIILKAGPFTTTGFPGSQTLDVSQMVFFGAEIWKERPL